MTILLRRFNVALALLAFASLAALAAPPPNLLNYQGRVIVGSTLFDGSGKFKFALVDSAGTTSFWSNDGSSVGGGEPATAVTLPVAKGLYAVLLGDTSLANMTAAVPAAVFEFADVRLRVWFDDGVNGSQRLSPDQRLAAAPYALAAAGVADGAITTPKIASGAVGPAQLASGAVLSANLAAGAVTTAKLAANSVTNSRIADGAVGSSQIADGAVGMQQLAVGAVGTTQLNSNAVTANKLAFGAVGTIQLADDGVTTAKIAVNAVTSAQLANGAVSAAQLADAAVTGSKIADGAVDSNHLAANLRLGGSATIDGGLTLDFSGINGGGAVPGLLFAGGTEGISSRRTAGNGQNGLFLRTAGSVRMTIANGGNVGIGTDNPTLARLQISGFTTTTLASYGFLSAAGTIGTGGPTALPLSIHASDRIAGASYAAFSDARIKCVTGVSDGAADLHTLRQLEVTDYTFKDRIARGSQPEKKLIAQQVETVYPQALSRHTDVVPDIYRAAVIRDGWIELSTDLQVGERVKLIASSEHGVYEVLAVRPGAFRSALPTAGEEAKIFVYGREVTDFRAVDYEAIAMLNVSATQELARQNAALQQRVAALERRLQPAPAQRKVAVRARIGVPIALSKRQSL